MKKAAESQKMNLIYCELCPYSISGISQFVSGACSGIHPNFYPDKDRKTTRTNTVAEWSRVTASNRIQRGTHWQTIELTTFLCYQGCKNGQGPDKSRQQTAGYI